jgi:hypothetical protein
VLNYSREEKKNNVSFPQKQLPNIDNYNFSASNNVEYLSKNFNVKPSNSHGYSNSSVTNNQKIKEHIDKEVVKKVEQYRLTLNEELLKILAEERQKEDNRERMLMEADTAEERLKLEKLFAIERSQASIKIVHFNK